MQLVTDPQRVIAHVVALRAEEEKPARSVAAEAAAPAEPEVIKKGKKEAEEGEEGAAPEGRQRRQEVSGRWRRDVARGVATKQARRFMDRLARCVELREAPEMRMKLIVGLGNPGADTLGRRITWAFWRWMRIAERAGIRVKRPEAKSLVGVGQVRGAGSGPGQAADDDESERLGGARSAGSAASAARKI